MRASGRGSPSGPGLSTDSCMRYTRSLKRLTRHVQHRKTVMPRDPPAPGRRISRPDRPVPENHGITGFAGGAADMGQQESVVQLPVARVDVRLAAEDVEASRPHLARAQRLLQGLVADEGAPRALLTTITPGRSNRTRSASMRFRVSGVAGPLPGPRGPYR